MLFMVPSNQLTRVVKYDVCIVLVTSIFGAKMVILAETRFDVSHIGHDVHIVLFGQTTEAIEDRS